MNNWLDFCGMGFLAVARNTEYVVIEAATPKPIAITISAVSIGFRRRLRRPSWK
jgi:hypothetical protein